jgi:formylglycine-generating enzyme
VAECLVRRPSDDFADSLAAMRRESRWLAIGVALSLTGLACFRMPMDEPRTGAMNAIGGAGGEVAIGTTGGATSATGMTGTTGGSTGSVGSSGGAGTAGSPGGTRASGGTTSAGGTTQPDGTTANGGSSGSGDASRSGDSSVDGGNSPPSCSGLAATCGPSGNDDCCTSLLVPGGTFYRGYDGVDFTDKSYPATVADFYLDKYEITVGRFRAFVNAGMGTQASPPVSGAGANPLIAGSGWDSTWNTNLPADTASLKAAMMCDATYQTWTDTAGGNETRPQNCLNW